MSIDETVYAAPESPLSRPDTGGARSLEEAIAGNWDFDIGAVLSEAWARVPGSKGVFWVGFVVVIGVSLAVMGVGAALALGFEGDAIAGIAVDYLFQAIMTAITAVFGAGIALYAIKRVAGDESASMQDLWAGLAIAGPVVGTALLVWLLTTLGFFLLILPGVYLSVGYMLAMPLVVVRGLGVWEAMETSRKSIQNHWFKIFGLMIVVGLAVSIGGLLTLGIGFIWAMPFAVLANAVLYERIFGYSGAVATPS